MTKLKFITHSFDDEDDDVGYWINRDIAKYEGKGYKILNAGVNDQESCDYTAWVVMVKSDN